MASIEFTTLCYIEKDDKYLMLHRVKKQQDINKDKYIGIGGHFNPFESPEECLVREVFEETGLLLREYRFRGIVTFVYGEITEYMCLYTANEFVGEIHECDEGELVFVPKSDVYNLNLWAGDKIFFRLLEDNQDFFSLKLEYKDNGALKSAILDGKKLELIDIVDENGIPNGIVEERGVVHKLGLRHSTVHTWIARKNGDDYEVLLQKRAANKDSNPLKYDISSAGHIDADEFPLPSAIRELKEELGITVSEDEIKHVGIHKGHRVKEVRGKTFDDNEISHVYLIVKSIADEEFVLQKEEVMSVKWIELDRCIEEVKNNTLDSCIYDDELLMIREYLSKI